MKKALLILGLALAIVFSGVGMVNAQEIGVMEECELVRPIEYEGINKGAGETVDASDGDEWAIVCLINTVNRGAQVLFFIMMGLVVALVIIGGFFILTGGGSEDNIAKGKKFITYAIVGVFIGVFAYAVPAILNFIMG